MKFKPVCIIAYAAIALLFGFWVIAMGILIWRVLSK